jgi:hypothetical protein
MAVVLKQVQTKWSYDKNDWEWLEGGYAIPNRFTVHAEPMDGDWKADVDVEVTGGKARTRHVAVSTDAPEGVTSTTVRQVPIREIAAKGALDLLRRNRVAKDGTTKLAPFMLDEAEMAYTLLERIVGYVEIGSPSEEYVAQRDAARKTLRKASRKATR